MKKYWYLLWTICCMAILPSCKDDDDDVAEIYKEWREENEAFIRQIKASGEYAELDIPSRMGKIYVKVIKEGDGKETIYYDSRVKVYYKGSLIDETEFDSAWPPYKDPVVFAPNDAGLRDGFSAALQYMKEGDKWNVWMPHELAYGSTGSKNASGVYTILPYSALNFEIEVLEIVKE